MSEADGKVRVVFTVKEFFGAKVPLDFPEKLTEALAPILRDHIIPAVVKVVRQQPVDSITSVDVDLVFERRKEKNEH